MTELFARTSIVRFEMTEGGMVDFATPVIFNSQTTYAWDTTEANRVYTYGAGIAVDFANYPAQGTINFVELDLDADGDPVTNVGIDAFINLGADTVPLTSLVSPAGTDPQVAADRFWEALLDGDDQIHAPDIGSALMFGDFLQILSDSSVQEAKTGGDDDFFAQAVQSGTAGLGTGRTSANALVGDAFLVQGTVVEAGEFDLLYAATLNGGDDTFTITSRPAYALVGDAYEVGIAGEVIGGDDLFVSNATLVGVTFGPPNFIIGDVYELGEGFVEGGSDTVTGSNYQFLQEVLIGDVGISQGVAEGGADILTGRAGHDYVAGDAYVLGTRLTGGNDTIDGGEDSDILAGDVLQAGSGGSFNSTTAMALTRLIGGNDSLLGGGGNDWMAGDVWEIADLGAGSSFAFGNDRLFGGSGDDYLAGDYGIFGTMQVAPLTETGGDDLLQGEAGNDGLFGGGGQDTLRGGADFDLLTGGEGADRFDFDTVAEIGMALNARDVVTDFQQGTDRIDFDGIDALSTLAGLQHFTWLGTSAHTGAGATLRYQQSGGNTLIFGDTNANGGADFTLQLNGLYTLGAADFTNLSIGTIQGTSGNDTLIGAAGGKTMLGLDGNDTIGGGAGADTILGGAGVDQLTGGLGADQFRWNAPLHTGVNAGTRDIVTDFQQGIDRLDLSAIDALTTLAGNQTFTFLGTAAHTGAGATLRYQQSGGNTIVFADIDANGGADFAIQLAGAINLAAADFVL